MAGHLARSVVVEGDRDVRLRRHRLSQPARARDRRTTGSAALCRLVERMDSRFRATRRTLKAPYTLTRHTFLLSCAVLGNSPVATDPTKFTGTSNGGPRKYNPAQPWRV